MQFQRQLTDQVKVPYENCQKSLRVYNHTYQRMPGWIPTCDEDRSRVLLTDVNMADSTVCLSGKRPETVTITVSSYQIYEHSRKASEQNVVVRFAGREGY